jgi:hypothetical protein
MALGVNLLRFRRVFEAATLAGAAPLYELFSSTHERGAIGSIETAEAGGCDPRIGGRPYWRKACDKADGFCG